MSDKTGIEWTRGDDGTAGATWNPVTGCTKISAGCDHCYAETFAERWRGIPGHHFEHGFDVTLRPGLLDKPLRWTRPRRIFVNSMSDLFHDQVPDEFIARVFAVMALTPQHTYQLLTKRHGRMRSLLTSADWQYRLTVNTNNLLAEQSHKKRHEMPWSYQWPLPNVWLGVSAEDQHWADIRIPALLDTPAAVRFASCEPLLGPINLTDGGTVERRVHAIPDPPEDEYGEPVCQDHGVSHCKRCAFLDWVIVGGESGPGARPMSTEWAQALVRECRAAEVPVFVKQLGSVLGRELRAGPKGGDWDAWPEDLKVREFPRVCTPAVTP